MSNINWKPDKTLSKPLYIQIIEYFKGKIEKGEFSPGFKLPSQRKLSDLFNVNRSTVVEALDELKAEGILVTHGRRGTKVAENLWDILTIQPPANWDEYISKGMHHPNLSTIQRINKLEFQPNIKRLSTGELSPKLFPKEMMNEVMQNMTKTIDSLGYEEPKGNIKLRKTLSQYLKRFNIDAKPSEILIVSGALQALQLIAIGIIHPQETVLVERPSYLKSLHVFQSAGVKLEGIGIDKKGIRPMEIIKRRKSNPKLLYTIPTFHNPTSTLMPIDRRKEILKLCKKKRLPVIEDNTYGELWIDEKPPETLKSLDDKGNVLYLSSTSKTLAPGFRIGYLVASEKVVSRLGDIKMQTDYGSSSISQLVVNEWISKGYHEKYLEFIRTELKKRRDFTLNILDKKFKSIARWEKPRGGFYIWLKLKDEIDLEILFDRVLQRGYLINIGNIYDFKDNNCIRLSYSYADLEDINKGLEILAEEIRKLR